MPGFRANIETVAHAWQRYDTAGDWQAHNLPGNVNLRITVSEMSDWRYEALVAVHELIEAILCKHRGITEEEATVFDKQFAEDMEHDRQVLIKRLDELKTHNGPAPADEHEEADIESDLANWHHEPGDHPGCPYFDEHRFATKIEEMLAGQLGVEWDAYEKAIEDLS